MQVQDTCADLHMELTNQSLDIQNSFSSYVPLLLSFIHNQTKSKKVFTQKGFALRYWNEINQLLKLKESEIHC